MDILQRARYTSVVFIVLLSSIGFNLRAQTIERLAYGDMDRWTIRTVKESGIIGGATKTLYEVGPERTFSDNSPYTSFGGSPWGNSNIMAKVAGIIKTNVSVYRDVRDNGYCAKLQTHIEGVTVLGLVDINVIATGSMFLGHMREPITTTKNAESFMEAGIAYTKKPTALRYDYKVELSKEPRLRMPGFGRTTTIAGQDCPITVMYLQKRYEDAKGKVHAKRIGTVFVKYRKSTEDWVNDATYEVMYGDITNRKDFDSQWMGFQKNYYTKNSKGKVVEIIEDEWGTEDDTPTHVILQFSSSHGGAFVGSPGNTIWIDNVKFVL